MITRIFNNPNDDLQITATTLRSASNKNLKLETSNNLIINASNITLDPNDLSTNIIYANNINLLHPIIENSYVSLNDYFTSLSKKHIDLTGGLDASLSNVDICGNLTLSNEYIKLIFANDSTIDISNHALTIDPFPPSNDLSGTVIIDGDLIVNGTTTTINSHIVDISDKTLKIASETSTLTDASGAGIIIGASDLSLSIKYDNASETFVFSKSIDVSGNINSNSLNLPRLDIGTTTISNGILSNSVIPTADDPFNTGHLTTLTDLTSSNKDVKLFTSRSTFAIENSGNVLQSDISDVSNTWISPPNYKQKINLRSLNSQVKMEFKVNYITSPEAEQSISFKVTRGLSAEDPNAIVFEDCSLGSNMRITLNNIYYKSFIDTVPSSTPYEIIGGNILNTFKNTRTFNTNYNNDLVNSMALSKNGQILAIGDEGNNSVYIYQKNNLSSNTRTNQSLVIKAPNTGVEFGRILALSDDGDILVVTDHKYQNNSGTGTRVSTGIVYVYTILTSKGYLHENIGNPLLLSVDVKTFSNDHYDNNKNYFGRCIALSGDGKTLAIQFTNSDSTGYYTLGSVYIYRYINENWTLFTVTSADINDRNRITPPENTRNATYRQYGGKLGLSRTGNTLVLTQEILDYSSSGNEEIGIMLYVFDLIYNNNSNDVSVNQVLNEYVYGTTFARPFIFMCATSGDGNTISVSSCGNNHNTGNNQGIINIYKRNTNTNTFSNTEIGKEQLTGTKPSKNEHFGICTALSHDGNIIYIGDPTSLPGSIYVCEFNTATNWNITNTINGDDFNKRLGTRFVISSDSAILAAAEGAYQVLSDSNSQWAYINSGNDVIHYNVRSPIPTTSSIPVMYSLHYKLNCPTDDNIDTSYGIIGGESNRNYILLQELYGP